MMISRALWICGVLAATSCSDPLKSAADAGTAHGSGLLDDPCASSAECADGLLCVSPPPLPNPFGSKTGVCLSDGTCPPSASWPAGCGGAGQPACPPYVSRGVQGDGCVWDLDCAQGSRLTCVYGAPSTPPGYCGTCL